MPLRMLNLTLVENVRRLLSGAGAVCCLLGLFWGSGLGAQDWSERAWEASWITHPTAPSREFAVLHFRRTFSLETVPDSLPVLVSADNRYQLFVNGQRVGEGPARGDLLHWRYETYDLGPYLQRGDNVIAAQVWNYGVEGPWSQQSYRTAFVLQPTPPAFADLRTDTQWKSYHNPAYSPIYGARERLRTYIVVGPQLRIAGAQLPTQFFQNQHFACILIGQFFQKYFQAVCICSLLGVPFAQKRQSQQKNKKKLTKKENTHQSRFEMVL